MSKLIATSQLTLMNLTERAEIRKETFYKLTNSADVPEAPSGNRNLFKGSRDFSGTNWVGGAGVYAEDYQGVKIFKKQTMWGGRSQYFEVKTGEEYVFSAYVKSSAKTDRVTFYLFHGDKQPTAAGIVSFGSANSQNTVSFDLTDEYQRIAIKIKITSSGWIAPRIERFNSDNYLFFGGYKLETGNAATPYSQAPEDLGWSTATLVPTQQQRYLWKFDYIYYSDGSVEIAGPVNLSISGEDGIAGKDGVGLKSTVVTYGLSASETTPPTNWTDQVPALTKGKYLWTKTVWTYTDNTTETGYQKTYIAKDGNNGEDGIPGKDGVGIVSTVITYAGSTSGATPPINGWTSSIPSVPAGSYLWTKTVWTYTDNTSETGYSVSKMGEKGEDGKNSYMHTAYANITKLCNENENFTITTSSIVRYGYADKWVYKTFEAGTYAATSATFGKDPYSGKVKQCDLVTDFSLTDSTGRGWLGTYSDNNANAVSDPSRYTWQLTKGPQGIQGIQGPQGIPGEPGADGRTQYTHIAYADNATGGGFSQTDQNKAYIGMYVDFTAADSNDPTKYRWTKWKGSDGAQGIPGKPGADGKTPYIHFAYADDDKGTDFSLTDKNQQFQGYYSDYTEADSTDYRKYKWVDRLANIKGGSRNYFKDSLTKNFQTTDADTFDWRTYIVDAFWKNKDRLKKNFVKMSFDITFPVALENDYTANIYFSAAPWYSNRVTFKADTTSRQHFEFEIDLSSASDDYRTDNVFIRFGTKYGFPSGFKIILENMMLSIGSYYPDYIQAIEDTQDQLDNKADQTLTQDQLNALAEKNALIQAEMEAKASMDTVNQWITAYQNYVNANEADKKKSEQALQDASNRLLQVKYDVNDLKQQWNFIDTYMSVQNEGLIIGKKDGSAYAKFSDDRISLFSGNSEVMYISQGTLNIANGIFTKTIQIGRFRFETHPNDADMLIIRFLGG